MKFDWEYVKIKLSSRKLWLSVVAFATLIMQAIGLSENEVAQAGAIIMAGAVVIGYCIGNGLKDD